MEMIILFYTSLSLHLIVWCVLDWSAYGSNERGWALCCLRTILMLLYHLFLIVINIIFLWWSLSILCSYFVLFYIQDIIIYNLFLVTVYLIVNLSLNILFLLINTLYFFSFDNILFICIFNVPFKLFIYWYFLSIFLIIYLLGLLLFHLFLTLG